jgi:hypothetical protein
VNGRVSSILALASALALPIGVGAEIVVVHTCESLRYYDTTAPGTLLQEAFITGIGNSGVQCIVGADHRPSTGELYGLVSDQSPIEHRLYLLPPGGGQATQVGGVISPPFHAFFEYGLAFDPVTDLIRAITAANDNQRLDPDHGSSIADADLAYAAGDTRQGHDAGVVAIAHAPAGHGASTVYGIDTGIGANSLVRIGSPGGAPVSPDSGQLFTIGKLGVDPEVSVGFDVSAETGIAYAAFGVVAGAPTSLYTVDLATGAVTLLGALAGDPTPYGLAVVANPPPPGDDFFLSPVFPDFGFQVRISGGQGAIAGAFEPSCIEETLCVSGAIPGRSEVFLRIVGPKPNGKLWPTLVKFSTSTVEVWIRQLSSGVVRYYRLQGASPGSDVLPGLFDREGFDPQGSASTVGARSSRDDAPSPDAAAEPPPLPGGPFFTSPSFPDFRFKVRVRSGAEVQPVRQEASCIEETICVSAAVPGRSEVFLRVVGPKPNGYLWPTLVKFTTSAVEVWIEQISTGSLKYYELAGASPGVDELPGLFDRTGFLP